MASVNKYQDLFRARVSSAIAQANAVAQLSHQGVKGSILEILVGQLFEPLLPADIGIGTGQIIDSFSGRQSNQLDIILYNKAILPPLLVDQKLGIFPIESVLYVIEVKTTLNSSGLRKAHDSAKSLATNFHYRPGFKDEHGKERDHILDGIKYVVFALHSDLSGQGLNEAERYKKLYIDDCAYIRAICVAGKEYWYDNGNYWLGFNNEDKYDEILSFIGGVSNTYHTISSSRGSPLLGHYIVPRTSFRDPVKSRNFTSISGKCSNCNVSTEIILDVGSESCSLQGKITAREPCPSCGGIIESESAIYVFEGGKLISQSSLKS